MYINKLGSYCPLFIVIILAACQTVPVSKGGNMGFASTQQNVPALRTCWRGASSSASQTTFILAVGANTGDLRLANQDAQQFAQTMQRRFKVPPMQVCVLSNGYRAEFELALLDLVQWVKPDDRVLIFFSGHGSHVPDDNGDERDGWDEVFVTADAQNEYPKREDVVVDDNLVRLINALPTEQVITFIDACHSGGMYKDKDVLLAQARIKFLMKGDLGTILPAANHQNVKVETAGGLEHIKGVVFASAQENQEAREYPNKGGFFTTIFLQNLAMYPNASLVEVFQYTALEMRKRTENSKSPQYPQKMGDISLVKGW